MDALSLKQTQTISLSKRASLLAELRALWAVAKREWSIFVRYPTWFISLFVWPIIFPASYLLPSRALAGPDGSGLKQFVTLAGTNDFYGYIVIGTMIWMWQNIVIWNVGFALRSEQWRGTLESNWMTPTWRFSFLLGSSMTQLLTTILFLVIAGLEYHFLLGVQFIGSPWLVLFLFVLALPSIYGLGFAFASLVVYAKEANSFVFMVRGIFMIFCGITFPLAVMPGWMQAVAAWLPQSYIIAAMRKVILAGTTLEMVMPEIKALLLFGAAWLVIGYVAFIWMERRARQVGAIGQF